jgi:co-chaperonin GroES (HSP10)
MSNNYIEPATDHLIVVDGLRETIIDGITMPDNEKQQEMVIGTVIFAGPDADHTQPHDTVLYGPYAGKTIIVNGSEMRILREGQIEAYVRKSQ